MNFYILGSDNKLTQFHPDQLINFGPKEIGQYVIESWEMEPKVTQGNKERIVEVSMILTRKIGSVFMVTYLPTILMNMINQGRFNLISSVKVLLFLKKDFC